MLDKNVGVQVRLLTRLSTIVFARRKGSWISSVVARQTVFPLHSGTNCSTIETSKENAAIARAIRPGLA